MSIRLKCLLAHYLHDYDNCQLLDGISLGASLAAYASLRQKSQT